MRHGTQGRRQGPPFESNRDLRVTVASTTIDGRCNNRYMPPGSAMEPRRKRAVVDPFGQRLRDCDRSLTRAAHRVLTFIDRHRATALACSAAELAASVGTSDATVVRAVQALGYQGLGDLRQALAMTLDRRSTPVDDMRRTLGDVGQNAGKAIDLVLETHRDAIDTLRSSGARDEILRAVALLRRAQRIVIFGIGPSAPLAHYVAILLTRNGRRSRVLDATGIALADQLIDLHDGDALLVLAYGRSYKEVAATFSQARTLHLPIVLITDTLEKKLSRHADIVVPAKRGRADQVALHGTTLVVLEAIVLSLAASDQDRALQALQSLNDLREIVGGVRAGES
jgi:DNA-binding MurR/RpiR family transcriptional regulator